MAGLKAVLFDNDGTLVDSRELLLASFHYAGPAVLGRQLSDEEYLQKVGQPLAVQVKDYTDDPVLQERVCEAYRAHNKTVHDKMIKAFPGTVEALAELAGAGLKLGVVTSKRHAVAWRGLEMVGAASYLDCCVGWDDIERPKPDPQPVVRGCGVRSQRVPVRRRRPVRPAIRQRGRRKHRGGDLGHVQRARTDGRAPLVRLAHLGRADRKHAGVALAFDTCGASDTLGTRH